MFNLKSSYTPTGDQPQAIEKLVAGIRRGEKSQVLLGVTGSGKTFTMANVIQAVQKPTLIISHNKTLAAQLYQEFRDFFPDNAVSYFVSYYDYYQPESYIPVSDTYIEKETEINEEIDKLRLKATTNLLTRKDVIVVASVSCIYNLGSPEEYGKSILELRPGVKGRKNIMERMVDLQYGRSDYDFKRGTFRLKGEILDIFPSYDDFGIRISIPEETITAMEKFDPVSGKLMEKLDNYVVYPAKHYMTDPASYHDVFEKIRKDKEIEVANFKNGGKILEAHRLNQRVEYDLEMVQEVGYVNGIENYSRYFDKRNPGDPPYSLLEFFPKDYLLIIDESHMSIPQIRGMYNGDFSRKSTLIDYGFRLKAALDNRPLRFDEFQRRMGQTIYTTATPSEWELSQSGKENVVEQLIRPTGLIEPEVEIRPTTGQIKDLIGEIVKRVEKGERVLVTTLTKRTAEELTEYLNENNEKRENPIKVSPLKVSPSQEGETLIRPIKVAYLHSDVQTLERSNILEKLRRGDYDVLIGVNLLREGLDLPEVSLVAILDADKEGFLRSHVSLVQTMGRAARHLDSKVLMYADRETDSMKKAIEEVNRRRKYQVKWNQENKITPQSINKPIREQLTDTESRDLRSETRDGKYRVDLIDTESINNLTPEDRKKYRKQLTKLMNESAAALDFEGAIHYREKIKELEK